MKIELDVLQNYRKEIADLVDASRDSEKVKSVKITLTRISRELNECEDSKLCNVTNLVDILDDLSKGDITEQLVIFIRALDEEIMKKEKQAA